MTKDVTGLRVGAHEELLLSRTDSLPGEIRRCRTAAVPTAPQEADGRHTAVPSDFCAEVFSAARADMEVHTALPAARHYLENLLAAFSNAICDRDVARLGELTRSVSIGLGGPVADPGVTDADRIIRWFAQKAVLTAQTITNLSVRCLENSIVYTAVYQDWRLNPRPECLSVGTYQGRLRAGPTVWKWEEHAIFKLSATSGGREEEWSPA